MSRVLKLKRIVEHIPPSVGRLLSAVPYSWRLGSAYNRAQNDIDSYSRLSEEERKRFIFERVRDALHRACRDNSFYRSFYAQHGFDLGVVQTFADIRKIPIVTKADLQSANLEERATKIPGAIPTNTGGSSGQPLSFYLDKNAFAREWAHMHDIWSRASYRTTDLKLTLRGKNLQERHIVYNAVHNEYMLNAYISPTQQAQAVNAIAEGVRFIHGYPSAIYEFIQFCRKERPDVLTKLRRGIKGVLLGSEFPAPVYRDLIEEALGISCISWYGHSEFAILAPEGERYHYMPYQTYGYCEAVGDGTGDCRLVGTSYFNDASPFIRYDTGDLVTPDIDNGVLKSFQIAKGRVGEYIQDSAGNRISLTALIFGRHHKAFDNAKFIQIRQEAPGQATLVITVPKADEVNERELRDGFDKSNVDIVFSIEVREHPYRTPSGKVPLLIPSAE